MNCFITGGNRGIGLEFAKQLSEKGHHVLAGFRNPKSTDKLKKI
ncbi:MAG: SDR family NAD(P)-dependent oxidoreductase, partial [Candidatus Marinimicrobia bacterium]|nr:SDR family NAD(P)-dependent oxidoreductase [Candidatus Neomarinimicrobiota bacterium]